MKAIAELHATRASSDDSEEDSRTIKTILVATDLSQESFRALAYAMPLAERFGSAVHLIHVYDPEVQHFLSQAELTKHWQWQMRRFGRVITPDECHIVHGRPWQEITATAADLHADLIVATTHGRTGLKRFMLGSTAEKIVRHAPCPVLIVRDHARASRIREKILVPVDFSACAKEGARYASRFATALGADVELMHVVTPPFVGADGCIATPELAQLLEAERSKAEEELESMINLLPLATVNAESRVATGTAVTELVARTSASDIDLVVTSTHGGSALRHVLLGSVAEELVRRAHCPVLVVPSHKRPAPGRELASEPRFDFADASRIGAAMGIA
ncbi:MAG: universal stress protein [Burkholderiales bacterium]